MVEDSRRFRDCQPSKASRYLNPCPALDAHMGLDSLSHILHHNANLKEVRRSRSRRGM